MVRERLLYKIFPIKRQLCSDYPPFGIKIIGFWGFIFRVFKVETYGKVYRYYGSYWSGIKSQYRFNKREHIPFSITITEDRNWQIYKYLKSWMEKGK